MPIETVLALWLFMYKFGGFNGNASSALELLTADLLTAPPPGQVAKFQIYGTIIQS